MVVVDCGGGVCGGGYGVCGGADGVAGGGGVRVFSDFCLLTHVSGLMATEQTLLIGFEFLRAVSAA